MKKILSILAMCFCFLCATPAVEANAADLSVTPIVGVYKVTSGGTDTLATYGVQLESRYNQLALGFELNGVTGDMMNDADMFAFSGVNPNVFARFYLLDQDKYVVQPFVGAGVGYTHTDYKVLADRKNMFTWNVEGGLRADLMTFSTCELNAIAAVRYAQFGNFKHDDTKTVGGYVGLGLTF